MFLGKVAGSVVATRKNEKLVGFKLLVVKQVDMEGQSTGAYAIAVDTVGAGVGKFVLYSVGGAARQTTMTTRTPCDATVIAIVDNWEVHGQVKYGTT